MNAEQVLTELSPQQEAYIEFCSTGGIKIDEDGNMEKISSVKLAEMIGVSRTTLWNWQKSIPDFWDLVATKRNEIYGRSRATMVYRAMFQKAMKGDVQAAKLILNQADALKTDKSEIKHEITSIDAALDSLN